ncbi:MAG TPA: MmgE/PrpD family protein [Acetobacteraceae bacterium]|nr:MmgE/PrpD family protein [Acetobacteraceae bacterium]
MSRPDSAVRFASHVAETRFENLSPEAVERAKVFILDTIGVGIAGSTAQGAEEVRQAASRWGAGEGAAVWGIGLRLPPAQAALVNAFQVHNQEFDALHEAAVLHAPATLLPALLADAGARDGITGRDLITAFTVGVDVACGLGLAARRGLRFFRPATAGGFGAVAGVAHLRGFSADQVLAAFGHQLGQVAGTMQAHTEGSPLLPYQVGTNARAAIVSCDLVEAGLGSLRAPFEGPYGYLPLFEGEYDLAPILAELGRAWRVAELSHKPYPSGRATHGGIEGLMRLRAEHGFSSAEVEAITVIGPPLISRLVDRPPLPDPGPGYARLCMPFVLAKVLQQGALDLAHFRGHALADPATFALAARVRMVADGNPDPNIFAPQRVEVRLRGGRVLGCDLPSLLASPARPLSRADRTAKFERCLAFAATERAGRGALADLIETLDQQPCLRGMINAIS